MNASPSRFYRFSLLGLLSFGAEAAMAAELTRGPYLQNGTPTNVVIRWRTSEPTESVVFYRTNLSGIPVANIALEITTEHHVSLSGLSPETKYFYSLGTVTETLAGGPEYFFYTAPPVGKRQPTRIWAIGDAGTFNTGSGNQVGVRDAYYAFTTNRYTDVWLALGDNAYYNGTDTDYQTNFFNVYPALLRQSVLWSTLGNHETYGLRDDDGFTYHKIFTLPSGGEGGGIPSGTENYYSFDYANIHFVCLDSELSDRTLAGPMLTWLAADLAANTNDWLIAFWHSPPYSKGSHNSDNPFDNFGNMIQMRTEAVPLLESYGVDLVLGGHSHIYERSFFLNGHYGLSTTLTPEMLKDAGTGRPAETGPYIKTVAGPEANLGAVYVVAGSAGWATSRTGFHPVMCYDALSTGSLVVDIDGNRLDAKFVRDTGAIEDHFTIIKGIQPEPLRICVFTFKNGQTVARWKSVAGQSYQIETATDLTDPQWRAASDTILASGATTSWTNNVAPTVSQTIYRVVELPVR